AAKAEKEGEDVLEKYRPLFSEQQDNFRAAEQIIHKEVEDEIIKLIRGKEEFDFVQKLIEKRYYSGVTNLEKRKIKHYEKIEYEVNERRWRENVYRGFVYWRNIAVGRGWIGNPLDDADEYSK